MGVKGDKNGGKIRCKQSVPGLDTPDLATLFNSIKNFLSQAIFDSVFIVSFITSKSFKQIIIFLSVKFL